jgi:hypothetical protein
MDGLTGGESIREVLEEQSGLVATRSLCLVEELTAQKKITGHVIRHSVWVEDIGKVLR